jgi:lipase
LKTFDVSGIPVAYLDEGQGDPVLLAHCSSGSHRMWSPLIRELTSSHRVLAPDLIGYGQSARWPDERPYEPDADVHLIAQLARKADRPVHLVGHSYGAAMALEAARLLGSHVRALTLIEPVSFHLLPSAGCAADYAVVKRVAAQVYAAMDAGDRRKASAVYMGFWLGRFRWWLAPQKLKAPVMETVDKVAKEFAAIESQTVPDLGPYRAIRVPVLLLYGGKTRAPAKTVVHLLERTLPLARAAVIPGAGHMSPLTHRDEVNRLVLDHIREIDRSRPAELERALEGRSAPA